MKLLWMRLVVPGARDHGTPPKYEYMETYQPKPIDLAPPVPAETPVDGSVLEVDEVHQSAAGNAAQVGSHEDLGDLVEVPGKGQVANPGFHQVDVLAQQHRQTESGIKPVSNLLFEPLDGHRRTWAAVGFDPVQWMAGFGAGLVCFQKGQAHQPAQEVLVDRIAIGEVVVGDKALD